MIKELIVRFPSDEIKLEGTLSKKGVTILEWCILYVGLAGI